MNTARGPGQTRDDGRQSRKPGRGGKLAGPALTG